MRPYSPGGMLNALASARTESTPPTPSIHRLRLAGLRCKAQGSVPGQVGQVVRLRRCSASLLPCGACLFDLDGVLTQTAAVHAAAWKEMFDGFLRRRRSAPGEPFVPFDTGSDYAGYVDGRPRADGVRAFLASRGIDLPEGSPGRPAGRPRRSTAWATARTTSSSSASRADGVEVYDGSGATCGAVRAAGLRTRRRLVQRQHRRRSSRRRGSSDLLRRPRSTALVAAASGPARQARARHVPRRRRAARRRPDGGRRVRGRPRRRRGRPRRWLRPRGRRRPGRPGRRAARRGSRRRRARSGRAAGRRCGRSTSARAARRMTRDRPARPAASTAGTRSIPGPSRERDARPRRPRPQRVGVRALERPRRPARQPRRGRAARRCPGTYLNSVYELRPLPYAEAGYGYPESGQTVINVTNGKLIRLLVDDEPFDVRYGDAAGARARARPAGRHCSSARRRVGLAGRPTRCGSASTRLVSLTQRAIGGDPLRGRAARRGAARRRAVRAGRQRADAGPVRGPAGRRPRSTHPLAAEQHDDRRRPGRADPPHPRERPAHRRAHGPRRSRARRRDVDARRRPRARPGPGHDGHRGSSPARSCGLRQVPRLRLVEPAVPSRPCATRWSRRWPRRTRRAGTAWSRSSGPTSTSSGPAPTSRSTATPRCSRRCGSGCSTSSSPAPRAERRPIPAKGLTGPGYDGHTFWDTETFVLPMLTYTQPGGRGDALRWRHSTLPVGARAGPRARARRRGVPVADPQRRGVLRATGRRGPPRSTSTPTSPTP